VRESPLDAVDIAAASRRLVGVVARTPLVPFPSGRPGVELRLKLECRQETGAFKARGAWNQIAQLTPAQRRAGVVTTSSGNHGKALAWAAKRASVKAAIVMPKDAYPNKIQACRDLGAEVLLAPTREGADDLCRERVLAGAVLVHPYDALRTIEGAGTVGLEIQEEWPSVDLVLVPLGGGGLLSGTALAFRGTGTRVIGVEPAGAPKMTLALARGEPVRLGAITTKVQGLCPPAVGALTLEACRRYVAAVLTLEDAEILEAQRRLVVEGGYVVEPAGAAGVAAFFAGKAPPECVRVVAIVSGGNPDPAQLANVRQTTPMKNDK
jgi:threonine dehydratase